MEQIVEFLNANRSGYLATVDGAKPRVRPFEFQFARDGKLCFCTANNKPVFAQLQASPWIEFSATSPQYVTVRVSGQVRFQDDREAKQRILDSNPLVKSIYQSADNPAFEVFFVEHGEAVLSDFSGNPPRSVSF